jgi:hypothetical protein
MRRSREIKEIANGLNPPNKMIKYDVRKSQKKGLKNE